MLVAVIPSSNSPEKSSGGVIVNPSSSPGSSVHDPSPLSTPAERLAPLGTPETVSESDSDPSVSVREDDRSSGIALSSTPDASDTTSVGASATPETETVIDSAGDTSVSTGCVRRMFRKAEVTPAPLTSWSCAKVNFENSPVKNSPTGIRKVCHSPFPEYDPPSRPQSCDPCTLKVRFELIPSSVSNPIAWTSPSPSLRNSNSRIVSSVIVAGNGMSFQLLPVRESPAPSSITAASPKLSCSSPYDEIWSSLNATSIVAVSVAAARTESSNSPEKSEGGVIDNPSRSPGASVHDPSPLSTPADRLAPLGTPDTVTLNDSDPSASVSEEDRSSGIALSSAPPASVTTTTGVSASGVTLSVTVAVVSPVTSSMV